ncbi:glycosyl hydrolase [Abyssalbus ytuae]|uniref:Glycoside hydrolase n=1 Tax=Abyssalbus ytuae TaxID=2926907 RepID=A0A9E6ZL48_9FLAO|nr:glycosyl hydrolase [Abyssalbus ytuae]UOB17774.1 glycoside hydrolase [Abyssalbus ytuae]
MKRLYIYIIVFILAFPLKMKPQVSKVQNNIFFNTKETKEAKTWTRWWWLGSAVDKDNIKTSLIELYQAGIGGVEITPIYGVKGEEGNYLDFLSPEWMNMLEYTIMITDSLGMGVDMPLGTGWPYGGPQVSTNDAATKLDFRKIKLPEGEKLYERVFDKREESTNCGKLLYALAYDEKGNCTDISGYVENGYLTWKAKKSDYDIYLVFTAKTGQKVKRAAPGGEGYTMDHYSKKALLNYLEPFNHTLGKTKRKLRSVFNDSYEVYETDFTPDFFNEFKKRKGYDLKPYLPLLLNKVNTEKGNRVRHDYRETISDLLFENFAVPWSEWAKKYDYKTRYQAHGSPGNLIDLYASSDIPECETFGSMPFDIPGLRRNIENIRQGDADPVMLKFSSSAGHIAGKKLVSAESFTWLREHFKTALSQCKPEVEDLFLNGVNHIFLHGSTYSPQQADWPGWKFYASVNFHPNNTIWEDAPALFDYIKNCQTILQNGKPDNEILLYWPVHDAWSAFAEGTLFLPFQVHKLDDWLKNTSFYQLAKKLIKKGYGVDFISDRFLNQAKVVNGEIILPGGKYKSLILPDSHTIPLTTMQKVTELKNKGAMIVFEGLPESVPGLKDYEENNLLLEKIKKNLQPSKNVFEEMEKGHIKGEELSGKGLKFVRRDFNGSKIYYLVNHTKNIISDYIEICTKARQVIIYDPLTNQYGKGDIQINNDHTKVKLYLEPGQSLFLKADVLENGNIPKWNYFKPSDNIYELKDEWKLKFLKGGPELPVETRMNTLKSWTELGKDYEKFSGTAEYTINFSNPDAKITNWQLRFNDLRESAKIWLNDEFLGTVWSVPYVIELNKLKPGKNILKIQVTNLPANRLRALELEGREWKIFHEINMVNKDYQVFDATKWQPEPSGIIGPVTLTPLQITD